MAISCCVRLNLAHLRMRLTPWIALTLATWVGLYATVVSSSGQVVINEFLAGNTSGLKDQDGDRPDWIELHNPTDGSINLGGWIHRWDYAVRSSPADSRPDL